MEAMSVGVIGAGYVGLVTAACLADLGHRVVCVENDRRKLSLLEAGDVPIYEEGLEGLVSRQTDEGRLCFTDDLIASVRESEVIFLCVGTPPGVGGQPDLTQIEAAATAIGQALDGRYRVVVTKSTVPVGCGDWVSLLIQDAFCCAVEARRAVPVGGPPWAEEADPWMLPSFDVVSNPEFLREGTAIRDMHFPDRIVIGSASPRALDVMRRLYAPLLQGAGSRNGSRAGVDSPRGKSPVPLVETDLASAEMIKYAANAFLATKISFINEVANICERTGADVRAVAQGIGLDHRIGQAFLQAGIGWGGSCFPKDVAALVAMASDYGYEAELLVSVQAVNARQRMLVVQKLQDRLKVLKGKTIGLLGLAFKPGTDDLRDAPAMTIAQRLLALGAKVRAYDPHARAQVDALPPGLQRVHGVAPLAEGADALVLVTDWPEFRRLPLETLALSMRTPVIVDGRNSLERPEVRAAGLEYIAIGR